MDISYHYPPELLQLLIDTIPRLTRSKRDVVTFLRGAGISSADLQGAENLLASSPETTSKFVIVRTVLVRLNERGETTLRERREVVKRVVEFEDFSTCWPNDQLQAKGLVAEIRRVVNVKDSFTRMHHEREAEAKVRRDAFEERQRANAELRVRRQNARDQLAAVFAVDNPRERGERLEKALNALFDAYGIAVRDAFCLLDSESGGVVEQIDGVIGLDGEYYLVEVKFHSRPIDVNEASRHLVRIFSRGQARGIFVSATSFTDPALQICRDALNRTVVVLCLLDEIISVLNRDGDLYALLKSKIEAAVVDREPFKRAS